MPRRRTLHRQSNVLGPVGCVPEAIQFPSSRLPHNLGLYPLSKPEGAIHEYARHEGNYGLVNGLRSARSENKGDK